MANKLRLCIVIYDNVIVFFVPSTGWKGNAQNLNQDYEETLRLLGVEYYSD